MLCEGEFPTTTTCIKRCAKARAARDVALSHFTFTCTSRTERYEGAGLSGAPRMPAD